LQFWGFRRLLAGLVLLLACAVPASAQSRIAIVDATGISILDTGDGTERARFPFALPSGETFAGFEASADGGRLYVTAALSNAAALYVIDASTGENVARIQIPNGFRKAAVTPDGSRAFVNTHDSSGDGISVVDLATHVVLPPVDVVTDSCEISSSRLTAARYTRACVRPLPGSLPNHFSSTISTFVITPSSLTPGWTYSRNQDLIKLSLSPDGSRVFGAWLFETTTQPHYVVANDAQTGAVVTTLDLTTRPCCIALRDVYAALLPGRAFVRIMNFSTGGQLQFTDMATGAVLGTVSTPGQIVLDPAGNKTYTLESTRLSRLDNDTAQSTTVATGSGWLDAGVLKDQCPDAAVISPSIFTTQGGSGTLAITAPGSCSWTIDAGSVPGLSFNTLSGSGAATIPFTIAAASAPIINTFHAGTRLVTIERTMPAMGIDEPGSSAAQPFLLRGWAIDVSAALAGASPAPPSVAVVHAWHGRSTAARRDSSAPCRRHATVRISRPPTGMITRPRDSRCRSGACPRDLRARRTTRRARERASSTSRAASSSPCCQACTSRSTDPERARRGTSRFLAGPWTSAPRRGRESTRCTCGPLARRRSGSAPRRMAARATTWPRFFGPSFRESAYSVHGSLPPGSYTLEVFARSTVTGESAPRTRR
jgi:DNA-binding beta-propeller fold protein YncE